jgi:hypothetical protein
MSYYLKQHIDFKAHNDEVNRLMEAFGSGKPYRVPVMVYGSITNYFLNPELNSRGLTFKDFFENPEVQIFAQLEYQNWKRFNIYCDLPMGIPDDGWQLFIDFQNSFEAAPFGCPLVYFDGGVPDTLETLKENGELLYDMPETIDFNNGVMSRIIEFYEFMCDKCENMEYKGKPVKPPAEITGERTDGIFTLATKIRGVENLLVAYYDDPDLIHAISEHHMEYLKTLYAKILDEGVTFDFIFFWEDILLIPSSIMSALIFP